jgi:uncharacterized repeat protein (TIGR04076 family)
MTTDPSAKDQSYAVIARVIRVEGQCDAGHQVGDQIVFDGQTVQGKVCISALYSFLPKVFALMYGADFPWLEDKDVSTSACPDASENRAIFEFRRVRP